MEEKKEESDKKVKTVELKFKKSKPMNFEEADGNKPNPNFGKEEQYNTNCQTCVVAYEARRRGYNVEALGNTSGSLSEILSKSTNKAWIDPKIGKHPDYIKCGSDSDIDTPKKYVEFLEKILKENTRYTMEFGWKKNEIWSYCSCL